MHSWWVFLYVGAVFSGSFLNFIGLPGNWWIVICTLTVAFFAPTGVRTSVSWTSVFLMFAVAAMAEIYEFFSVVKGLKKKAGSRTSLLAMVGSITGSILGGILGAPLFPFGVIFGIIFFASVGAMAGAMLGEYGRSNSEVWEIGKIAFWGRLFGSVVKILVGAVLTVYAILVVLL